MTAGHQVQFAIFVALFGVVTVVGFWAARWRRPDKPQDLEEWGLGGRAFGNFVTWFLVGGDLYTAYTFVAVPALVYGVGAYGFFAVPFAIIGYPLVYPVVSRLWSVAHTHGFITVVKGILLLWTVLAALLAVAMTSGGWGGVFRAAGAQFARTGSGSLILPGSSQFGYVTLVVGSALALFLYPHAQTGFLAAR